MQHPAEFKYAATHEWTKVEGDVVVTGISDHAQDALGDLVYIELPEIGREVSAGEQTGVVESVKTASDIYAPVAGTIVEINTSLEDDPDFVNTDPYGKGWLYKIKPHNIDDVATLLSNVDYEASL
ncbi:glycine cleavage system protein GcvH [Acinetobacter sp.]|uniref:glycine cleavage system protein GcvH n=1 Tax=Acinetobacter sp. TaxID=472 RepID=UPI0031E1F467